MKHGSCGVWSESPSIATHEHNIVGRKHKGSLKGCCTYNVAECAERLAPKSHPQLVAMMCEAKSNDRPD